jgi:type IV pilus assembly protein PilV
MTKIPKAGARPMPGSQQGVMLIEALVAILLFALGIVAVMGLQANMIAQQTQAKYRIDASYLADQIIGKMWVDQGSGGNLSNYASSAYSGRASWDNVVAATLPNGTATIAVTLAPAGGAGGKVVTVTINWKVPEDPATHQYVAVANINPSQSP